jgi:imidazolonepropionase-like amidohydrolase
MRARTWFRFASASHAAILIAIHAQPAPVYAEEAPATLILTGAHVLDPLEAKVQDGVTIVLAGGRIAEVGSSVREAKGARRIDMSGLTVLPGLIDLHSHLLLHPYNEASWDDQVLRESMELRTIRAVVAAKATLEAGFTTLRDLGTEGAGFADVALRDAIAQGMIPGPRVYTTTRAIVASGCYGPSGFDPRWDVPTGAQVADGVDGVRKAVREQIAAGADWIKVYADYRRRPTDAATPTFSQEELNALVAEASSANVPVAAHAFTPEAIRRAVLAGVQTIEHGFDASDEVLALMRARDVVLCPTLSADEAMARYSGWKPGEPHPPRVKHTKETFGRALRSGVTIACGSDVGVFPHGENLRELQLMADYGMPVADVLRSATTTAAKVLRRGDDLGRISAGFVADLIAVRGNPLEDLKVLRHPIVVIKEGRIVANRSGWDGSEPRE